METQPATNEIPRDEWSRALEAFGKEHQSWIVEVEVVGEKIGDQEAEVTMRPLDRITADGAAGRVEISAGARRGDQRVHAVERAKRVWMKEPDIPGHEGIAIESEDGTMTIVHFRHVDPDDLERQLPGSES
jgi:hypothetical protein